MKERKKPLTKARNCYSCDHCTYLGGGDHMCDVDNEIVVDAWDPTDEFYHCKGKDYINGVADD